MISIVGKSNKIVGTLSYCSCWLNLGHPVAGASVAPLMVASILTIIVVEAAGQGDFTQLPGANAKKRMLGR